MTDPLLRLAVLREMASIRFHLTELRDHRNGRGGGSASFHAYVNRLQDRLACLEQELREYERALAIRVIIRRSHSR